MHTLPAKILIVQLRHIGELLFTTPLVRVLREAYPEAQIDWLVEDAFHELLAHHPLITNVIPVNLRGWKARVRTLPRLVRFLRHQRYDIVINFHRSGLTSSLVAMSGARRKCGAAAWHVRPWFHPVLSARQDIHQADACLEFAYAIGVPALAHRGLELAIDGTARAQADVRWQQAGLSAATRVVGINPGGSWPSKRWTAAGFAALCDLLVQHGCTPVLFGGPTDVAMVDEVVELTNAAPVVFTGQLSLPEFSAMVGKCRLFVSGDSGPLHIAASQQVPIVALFGPTDPRRYAPYGVPHHVVREDVGCIIPCVKKHCAQNRCMQAITAVQIMEAVNSLLGAT